LALDSTELYLEKTRFSHVTLRIRVRIVPVLGGWSFDLLAVNDTQQHGHPPFASQLAVAHRYRPTVVSFIMITADRYTHTPPLINMIIVYGITQVYCSRGSYSFKYIKKTYHTSPIHRTTKLQFVTRYALTSVSFGRQL